jgi:signal transduction histidine kinase
MKMKSFFFLSFLFPVFLLFPGALQGQERAGSTQKIKSGRVSEAEAGVEKIISKLELALEESGFDREKARSLADSVILASRSLNNKGLEMRASYIRGRVSDGMGTRDASTAFYENALRLANELEDYWYTGEILYRIGGVKRAKGDEIGALESFNASLQACRLSSNFKVMGSTYSMMGTIFRVNGLYDRAIEYTVNAKLFYEKAGLTEGFAWSAYILGRIYSDMRLPGKALDYFQEALELYSNQASTTGNLEGVAICYEQIGLLYLASGNYTDAYTFIDSTLSIYTASGSVYGISNSMKNLGIIAYYRGDYNLAQELLNESLRVKISLGDLLNMPSIYQFLGLCMIGEGRDKDGFSNLQRGVDLAISNNQTRVQLNIYSEMANAYLSKKDLANAIEYKNKQIEIQDMMLSGGANIKVEQLQAIYEIDRQNGLILELEKQNEINALIIKQHRTSQQLMVLGILAALLFSAAIFLFYNRNRQKNRQLKESNAAKDKLFAIIAHDLRGPTGNLAAYMEHLNTSFSDYSPDELRSILLKLYKSVKNVSLLLENLLLWAQTQLNKTEFAPTELRLSEILRTSIKGLKQTADSKEIEIKTDFEDQLYIFADSMMVQTIVRNILSNAIKFTPRGGSVSVSSSTSNNRMAIISFKDNGVGIDQIAIQQIFEISGTMHTAGTEDEKSTGLGLILVKEFIDRNHGTIDIESQKDKGTTVTIKLPLARK